jgi:spermidine synthase
MLFLSLFILGFSSLVSQIVMTRELIVSFYGNEFFIGWLLFGWLFWVGIGSVIIRGQRPIISIFRHPERSEGSLNNRALSPLLICHLLAALLVPLTIFWIRLSKSLFTSAAGQIPDLIPAVMVSFFAVAPLCLVFGIQFVAASKLFAIPKNTVIPAKAGIHNNTAYFYEALGFVLGGLVFSYGLVFLNEFQTSAVLIFLNVAVVFIFLFRIFHCHSRESGNPYFFIGAILAACLGLICFLFSGPLNVRSAALRFPNEKLVETKNSVYGNLAVTRTGRQLNFYESGLSVGTNQDEAFNEYLVHFPMLSNRDPQKVLLIGSGFSGALREILKYTPKQIFYTELDPSIIGLARAYIPAFRQILDGGRVLVIKEDPRRSLKRLPKDLDVIIINLPNPSTALINRYFTDDFFKEVRGHLKPDGVMATHLVFAADSISGPLGNLGTCLYKTIQKNFSSVVILPEDVLFILASGKPLSNDPKELIRRLGDRGIHNYFVNAPAIVYRYTTDRVGKTEEVFKANKTVRINSDLHPQGYLYNLIYWLSIFHQDLAGMFASIVKTNYFLILFLAIGLIFLLPRVIPAKAGIHNGILPIAAMSMGGFSLMSAEVIVIYGFQVFYGNLYYKIAWIISAFMAATALGAFWGNKKLHHPEKFCHPERSEGSLKEQPILLVKLHLGIGLYFALWLLFIWFAAQFQWVLLPELWIIFGAGIGVLIGLEFSCANVLFFTSQRQTDKFRLGSIYAADLFGSCLGALGVSVFMIPAYGVYKTLLFLMIINITLAGVLFKK